MEKAIFIDKTIFFPDKGILAVGDLHIGFDYMIQQSGILIPEKQVEETIDNLEKIFTKIKKMDKKIKKIIFLGDIKHSFKYEQKEKGYVGKIFSFLKKYFDEKDIILLRGNHDTIDYTINNKLTDYYIEDNVAFIHGDKNFEEIFEKKIKTIILGHIHPSVMLSDKQGIKREKYKCFLIGNYKNKEIIILPSFLESTEGINVEDVENTFSIIPKKNLINFNVFIVGEDGVYEFGKVKNI